MRQPFASLARALALGAALSLAPATAVVAQDSPKPDAKPDAKLDKASATTEAKKPTRSLAFDAAPADWKARPPEPRAFFCDYDLAAAEGDPEGARLNVLYYPVDLETYRGRLSHRWLTADGKPHTRETRHSSELEANGVKLYAEDLSGIYSPKEGAPKPGYRLLAVLIDAPGGSWTAWLFGPEKSVEKHRERYLAWVKSVRVLELKVVEAQPGETKAVEGKAAEPKPVDTDATRDVRFVHGAPAHGVPGPWAMAGYRIGKNALERLGITRERSWEIVVTHRCPSKVQYTCMLDGLLAATGASPGKMNLVHETAADEDSLETVVVHTPTNRQLVYRLKKELRDKIRPIDYAEFPAAEKMLESLKDDEIFEVVESLTRKEPD